MKLIAIKNLLLSAGVLSLCLASACERDTQITLNGGTAPEFALSGSGRLGFLQITGPKVREAPGEAAFIYWEIDPSAGYLNGSHLRALSPIRYGQVPAGYVQKFPRPGEAVPVLVEGEVYSVVADTTGANRAVIRFTIREGKAIIISDPSADANSR